MKNFIDVSALFLRPDCSLSRRSKVNVALNLREIKREIKTILQLYFPPHFLWLSYQNLHFYAQYFATPQSCAFFLSKGIYRRMPSKTRNPQHKYQRWLSQIYIPANKPNVNRSIKFFIKGERTLCVHVWACQEQVNGICGRDGMHTGGCDVLVRGCCSLYVQICNSREKWDCVASPKFGCVEKSVLDTAR